MYTGHVGDLFSSPAMTTVTVAILVILILSLLLLWLNIKLFHAQTAKYQSLFKSLGDEDAWGSPGWFLAPLYIVSTIIASGVIILLFVFQPHIL